MYVVYDPLYSSSAPIKHLGCDVMWYNDIRTPLQDASEFNVNRRL